MGLKKIAADARDEPSKLSDTMAHLQYGSGVGRRGSSQQQSVFQQSEAAFKYEMSRPM